MIVVILPFYNVLQTLDGSLRRSRRVQTLTEEGAVYRESSMFDEEEDEEVEQSNDGESSSLLYNQIL